MEIKQPNLLTSDDCKLLAKAIDWLAESEIYADSNLLEFVQALNTWAGIKSKLEAMQ